MKKTKRCCLFAGLLTVGGLGYNLIEMLWRGHTHWSMFFLGGVCFQIIGGIHRRLARLWLPGRCVICAAAVTAAEWLCGCVVNLGMGLAVWDYSGMRWNFMGQICLLYSCFWAVLSGLVGPVYTRCRRWLERGLDKFMPSRGSEQPKGRLHI